SEGQSMRDVSGVTGAGPIWQEIMMYLHQTHDSPHPTPAAGVVAQRVSFANALEPTRVDYFLEGMAMRHVGLAKQATAAAAVARIVEPVSDTVIALDPDIPSGHQRLLLKAVGLDDRGRQKVTWRIKGTTIAEHAT